MWIFDGWAAEYLAVCMDTAELDDPVVTDIIGFSPLEDTFNVQCGLVWLFPFTVSLEDWQLEPFLSYPGLSLVLKVGTPAGWVICSSGNVRLSLMAQADWVLFSKLSSLVISTSSTGCSSSSCTVVIQEPRGVGC